MLNSAVILSGGKSSRMGQDKALMPYGGFNSMTQYQYERLKKIFKTVYISTKENKFDFKTNLIYDNLPTSSPMVALHSVMQELKEDFFLISVDLPLIKSDAIKSLIKSYENDKSYDIYLFKSPNGIEPTAAIYTTKLFPKIQNCIKKDIHKLNYLIQNAKRKEIFLNDKTMFLNVNDISSYKKAIMAWNEKREISKRG